MNEEVLASAERPGGGEIKTFLIADVRGYTAFTQEHGDEAAAQLTAKFAEIVRTGVTARNGSVVDLRGDEALAVFASARQAIRAAMDLQSAFVAETIIDPSLPLAVGTGWTPARPCPWGRGIEAGRSIWPRACVAELARARRGQAKRLCISREKSTVSDSLNAEPSISRDWTNRWSSSESCSKRATPRSVSPQCSRPALVTGAFDIGVGASPWLQPLRPPLWSPAPWCSCPAAAAPRLLWHPMASKSSTPHRVGVSQVCRCPAPPRA
jgi:hypothetical protein